MRRGAPARGAPGPGVVNTIYRPRSAFRFRSPALGGRAVGDNDRLTGDHLSIRGLNHPGITTAGVILMARTPSLLTIYYRHCMILLDTCGDAGPPRRRALPTTDPAAPRTSRPRDSSCHVVLTARASSCLARIAHHSATGETLTREPHGCLPQLRQIFGCRDRRHASAPRRGIHQPIRESGSLGASIGRRSSLPGSVLQDCQSLRGIEASATCTVSVSSLNWVRAYPRWSVISPSSADSSSRLVSADELDPTLLRLPDELIEQLLIQCVESRRHLLGLRLDHGLFHVQNSINLYSRPTLETVVPTGAGVSRSRVAHRSALSRGGVPRQGDNCLRCAGAARVGRVDLSWGPLNQAGHRQLITARLEPLGPGSHGAHEVAYGGTSCTVTLVNAPVELDQRSFVL
jgi:hypothetical protein